MATRKKKARVTAPAEVRKSDRITEEDHDAAMRVLRAEYYQGVRGIVQSIKDAIESGELTSGEDINDRVSQEVDQSEWVIYTHRNFQVLMCSDHHDEYTEQMGEAPVEKGGEIKWMSLAYMAMEADVRDLLSAEGIT